MSPLDPIGYAYVCPTSLLLLYVNRQLYCIQKGVQISLKHCSLAESFLTESKNEMKRVKGGNSEIAADLSFLDESSSEKSLFKTWVKSLDDNLAVIDFKARHQR